MILVTCISGQRSILSAESSFSRYAVKSNFIASTSSNSSYMPRNAVKNNIIFGVAKSLYGGFSNVPAGTITDDDGNFITDDDGNYVTDGS